jgi:hypothetical protein
MTAYGRGNAHLSEASCILSLAHGTPRVQPRPPRMARYPRKLLATGHLRAPRAACSRARAVRPTRSTMFSAWGTEWPQPSQPAAEACCCLLDAISLYVSVLVYNTRLLRSIRIIDRLRRRR